MANTNAPDLQMTELFEKLRDVRAQAAEERAKALARATELEAQVEQLRKEAESKADEAMQTKFALDAARATIQELQRKPDAAEPTDALRAAALSIELQQATAEVQRLTQEVQRLKRALTDAESLAEEQQQRHAEELHANTYHANMGLLAYMSTVVANGYHMHVPDAPQVPLESGSLALPAPAAKRPATTSHHAGTPFQKRPKTMALAELADVAAAAQSRERKTRAVQVVYEHHADRSQLPEDVLPIAVMQGREPNRTVRRHGLFSPSLDRAWVLGCVWSEADDTWVPCDQHDGTCVSACHSLQNFDSDGKKWAQAVWLLGPDGKHAARLDEQFPGAKGWSRKAAIMESEKV